MHKIILLLILLTQICSANSVDEHFESTDALMKKVYSKESYNRNDIMVTIVLQEIGNADIMMILDNKENFTKASLVLVSSSLTSVYANILPKELETNEQELKIIKSFISRSGDYLSKNIDKLAFTHKGTKMNSMPYEFLVKAAERYNYKVEESKKLLKRFKAK